MALETEVKIRVDTEDLESIRQVLRDAGFRVEHPRAEEVNCLFDWPDGRLAEDGCALRLRRYGARYLLTYKGKLIDDPLFKRREELQTQIADFSSMLRILESLGFRVAFRYDKVREKYISSDGKVEVCIDETPIGCFVEIEGSEEMIETIAERFGWDRSQFINRNYVNLYREQGLGTVE